MPVEVEIKEISPCKQEIAFFVPAEDVEEAFKTALKEVMQTVSLPGFRKGKVPSSLIEKKFAKEIEQETQGKLVSEHYHKTLTEKEWKALSDPKVDSLDFSREKGFHFNATVEIQPEIKLKNYKGIKVTRPKVTVSDEEVADTLMSLRKERATLEKSTAKAKEGDHLTVKAEICENDSVLHTEEHAHMHVGHDHLADFHLAGLGKAVLGIKTGEDVSHEMTLGDDFSMEALRGKKVSVKITAEEVMREKLPEIDEDFLKPFDVTDQKALEERIVEDMTKGKNEMNEEAMCEEILSSIADEIDVPIPEDLLERQCTNLVRQTEAVYKLMSAPEEEREAILKEEIEKVKEPAAIQVRNFFILDAIANKEKVFVTEKEMAEHIYKMAHSQGRQVDELANELKEGGGLHEIRLGLRERKTVKWLLDKADVTEGKAKASKAKSGDDKSDKKSSSSKGATGSKKKTTAKSTKKKTETKKSKQEKE